MVAKRSDMKSYDVFRYRNHYHTKDMYAETNRIKSLEAIDVPNCEGLIVLLGRPINRREGAAFLQKTSTEQIGYFEAVLLNPDQGPFLHIQADARRADGGRLLEALGKCINLENSRTGRGETHRLCFLIKERTV